MEHLDKLSHDYMDGSITIDEYMHQFTMHMSELACDQNIVTKAKNAYELAQRILRRIH